MFEAIFEFITQVIIEGVVHVIFRLLRDLIIGIGACVFSLFSLFKVSPKQHFYTENFDKRVGMFWTGFLFIGLIIFLIVKF